MFGQRARSKKLAHHIIEGALAHHIIEGATLIEDKISIIRQKFLKRIETELPLFERFASDKGCKVESSDFLVEIQHFAHRVAGIAGALGFERLGRAASELDKKLQERPNEDARDNYDVQIQELTSSYVELCRNEISNDDE